MTLPDLRTVSIVLEQATGYDSVPTIERVYRAHTTTEETL